MRSRKWFGYDWSNLEGFISQELVKAVPEWKENLLSEVFALEQSALEWLELDLTGARVEVMIKALTGHYSAYTDCSGLEHEHGHDIESRRMTFVVEFGSYEYSNAPGTGSIAQAGRPEKRTTGADQQLAIMYPQLPAPLERMIFTWLGPYAVRVSDNLFTELLLGVRQTTPRVPASTTPRHARLIEWVAPTSDLAEADAIISVEQTTTTTRAQPQRIARASCGLYRPPRLRGSLTEERRAERARERQEALARFERETEEEIEKTKEAREADGVKNHKKTRRGKRAGRQAREWAARHEELAQAAKGYVRGEEFEDME